MKAWLIPISLTSLVAASGTARADQCAWVTEAQAQKAQSILTGATKFIDFCEPCGDAAPGTPQKIENVNIDTPSDGYRELTVNGKEIDLAYVFVKTSEHEYTNLAKLTGCPATGVSPSLAIESETKDGVMITADTKAPPPPPPPQMTPVTSVPAYTILPPPTPPPQVYVYTTVSREVPWLAIALAAGGGFITGSATTPTLLAIRRRRAMRPRAVDMPPR
jgi:hypothetical protein